MDVMAASPDWQTGPAPPRRCAPTALASRTITATSILLPTLSLSVVAVADGRAARVAFAVAVVVEQELIVKTAGRGQLTNELEIEVQLTLERLSKNTRLMYIPFKPIPGPSFSGERFSQNA
jgi:hypothetical protein